MQSIFDIWVLRGFEIHYSNLGFFNIETDYRCNKIDQSSGEFLNSQSNYSPPSILSRPLSSTGRRKDFQGNFKSLFTFLILMNEILFLLVFNKILDLHI